jgi:hypothetical protein
MTESNTFFLDRDRNRAGQAGADNARSLAPRRDGSQLCVQNRVDDEEE